MVAAALEDVELTVSTVPDTEFTAERLVLEHGGTLVNCTHAPAARAAELGGSVRPGKGSVLLNAGLVPGVANLLAAGLLARHPEADRLEIAFTILKDASGGRAGADFVHAGLTSRCHHRVLRVQMPEPFGQLSCVEVAEGDDFGFGGVGGGREIGTYLGFGDRSIDLTLRGLNAARLMQLLPRAAFSATAEEGGGPSEEPTAVWVGARRKGELLGVSGLECRGDYRGTAAAAQIFGEALLAIERPGCFNPEDLFGLEEIAPGLEPVGLEVSVAV
jgi:hypothetical protein